MHWLPSSTVFSPVNCSVFVLLPAQVWTAVMCTHAATPDAPLFPLVYPLCQIMIGVVRLESTSRLIPLRLIVCGLLSEVRLTCEQAAWREGVRKCAVPSSRPGGSGVKRTRSFGSPPAMYGVDRVMA